MALALFDSLLAPGGMMVTIPKISGTTRCMSMKFLPDVKYHREARLQKFLTLLIWSVNYGSEKPPNAQIACFLEMQLGACYPHKIL